MTLSASSSTSNFQYEAPNAFQQINETSLDSVNLSPAYSKI